MEEFSHEELQEVIKKYDTGIQKFRTSIQDKNEKIAQLEQLLTKN